MLSFVATIFVPLTFVTGFFGMSFCWLIDQIDSPIAFLLSFVAPIAAGHCLGASGFAVSYGATAVEARSAASAAAMRALLPGGEAVEGSATLICSSARLVGMT